MLIQLTPVASASFWRANARVAHTLINSSSKICCNALTYSALNSSSLHYKAERNAAHDGARSLSTSLYRLDRKPTIPERILQLSPKPVQPYLALIRFDKPIGTWLTLLPALWSLSLACGSVGHVFDPKLTALFCVGAFLMRGAGCTINDMWDKNIDRLVERTKTRPIASNQITRNAALVFLAAQLSCALGVLLQLNQLSVLVGAACVPMVATYPLFKRFTYWPQLMLGVTFNWGTLIGWTAVCNALDAPALCLLTSAISWTLLYDTIYAHQDKRDDALIGVKSTALLFGDRTKPFLRVCGAVTVGSLGLAAYLSGSSWPLYVGLAGVSGHFLWQIETLKLNEPADCLRKFKSNRDVGLIILASILLSNAVLIAN